VESIIRDLVHTAVNKVREERFADVRAKAEALANARLLDLLVPPPARRRAPAVSAEAAEEPDQRRARLAAARDRVREQLERGDSEEEWVELTAKDGPAPMIEVFSGGNMEEIGLNLQDMMQNVLPNLGHPKQRRVKVSEARRLLVQEELNRLVDLAEVKAEAVRRVEQMGIVFIDELDKVAGRESTAGPDVSRQGVQRDLLPIVEGTTVNTRHGEVRTHHILFIAAGAFHVSKPSDLIPELQGRFPLRAELQTLTAADFKRILIEPQQALLKQYTALLATEGVTLVFEDEAIDELAAVAHQANLQAEDIGARRLHTVLERVLEEVSFSASEMPGRTVTVTRDYVRERIGDLLKDQDLSRYIL
jgi:ATP-dependent HslUV protease ATP-binding subunit HslU